MKANLPSHWTALSADRSPQDLVTLLGELRCSRNGLERMDKNGLHLDPRQRVVLQEVQ